MACPCLAPAHSPPPLSRTPSRLLSSLLNLIHLGLCSSLALTKLVTSPVAYMAKLMPKAQSHVTQEQHVVAVTPTFLNSCSLTSENHLLIPSILG